MKNSFKAMLITALASVALPLAAATVINVDSKPQQEMMYGMDFERLWSWGLSPEAKKQIAQQAVADCHVTYVRVAIDAASEFKEGEFNWDFYKSQLDCMTHLKEANPNVKFFASPRPIHEAIRAYYGKGAPETKTPPYNCFPLWIGEYANPFAEKEKLRKPFTFHPDKAATYMARQVQFLRSKGFDIAYLDLLNECGKYYKAPEIAQMADGIRKILGKETPIIVAPSSFDWGSCEAWLNEAIEIERTDFFDIISSHNTKNIGTPEAVVAIARKLNKPVWNTELHGFVGPDDLAAQNTQIIWKHIRAGFNGFNDWLSLGNQKKTFKMFRNVGGNLETMRTYYIFKQLVNTSVGGNYLETNVPEGITANAAFIQGKTLTVWVLNADDKDVKDVEIALGSWTPASAEGEAMFWGPENQREGSVEKVKVSKANSIKADIKAKTLYCFTVKLK